MCASHCIVFPDTFYWDHKVCRTEKQKYFNKSVLCKTKFAFETFMKQVTMFIRRDAIRITEIFQKSAISSVKNYFFLF